jgi:serine/threonine protein kinase
MCINPALCLVLEFCSQGSLFDVLNRPNENITWQRVLKFILDTVKGLNCLHSWKPQILHRDIKSLNLLVDDNWVTKVSDFGLSRFNTTGPFTMDTLTKLRGTFSYTAPEVYFGEKFTTKSDVFAVGIVIWEVVVRALTGRYQVPYSEFEHLQYDFQIIMQTAKNKLRPTLPSTCPQPIVNLTKKCWSHDPNNRPTTMELVEYMQELFKEYERNQKAWDQLLPPNAPTIPAGGKE